jgi:dTDP-4-dehydrorhamnose reductase
VRVLVTGAAGQLGVELLRTAPAGIEAVGVSHGVCDISDSNAVATTLEIHCPEVVINAAAYTKVDAAEDQRELAYAVNETGARNVAVAAEAVGARLIHISTDYVFDGNRKSPYPPDSSPNPLSVYGASKLAGEKAALGANSRALVLRSGWLYASHGTNFLRTILVALQSSRPLRVVDDQTGVPTSARELAEAIWDCVGRPEIAGVHHWVNAGMATWYEFAARIQELALLRGLIRERAHIAAIPTSGYPTRARRPAFSVLDASDLWRDLGKKANSWDVALAGVLTEIASARPAR